MKILLYEPGDRGHRLVVLNYVKRIVENSGFNTCVVCWPVSPLELISIAKKEGCGAVLIMMLDGRAAYSFVAASYARAYSIVVSGIYYLYNNLYEFPRWLAWWGMLVVSPLRALFISTRMPLNPAMKLLQIIRYLPDPWDASDFVSLPRELAKQQLGIRAQASVFLVFGELDSRKGADKILSAIEYGVNRIQALDIELSGVVFMFCGRCSSEILQLYAEIVARTPSVEKFVKFENRRIPESDVGVLFSAADCVVCSYPKSFTVSSGTVTRALAAGCVIMAAEHGETGNLVREFKLGYTFDTESIQELWECVEMFLRDDRAIINESGRIMACRKLAEGRELQVYGRYLVAGLFNDAGGVV